VFKDELKPPSSHPKCVPVCAFIFPSAPLMPLTVGFLLDCAAPRCKCSFGSSLSAGACLPARCVFASLMSAFVQTSCSLRCLPVRTGKRLRLPLARCRRARLKGALSRARRAAPIAPPHTSLSRFRCIGVRSYNRNPGTQLPATAAYLARVHQQQIEAEAFADKSSAFRVSFRLQPLFRSWFCI
jgi:hypothetical protein